MDRIRQRKKANILYGFGKQRGVARYNTRDGVDGLLDGDIRIPCAEHDSLATARQFFGYHKHIAKLFSFRS